MTEIDLANQKTFTVGQIIKPFVLNNRSLPDEELYRRMAPLVAHLESKETVVLLIGIIKLVASPRNSRKMTEDERSAELYKFKTKPKSFIG